jgi:hypothetical protein
MVLRRGRLALSECNEAENEQELALRSVTLDAVAAALTSAPRFVAW